MFRFRTKCGAYMVLCPECWLLTKAGTSFCRRGMAWDERETESESVERETKHNNNHSHSLTTHSMCDSVTPKSYDIAVSEESFFVSLLVVVLLV